jgi:hypothetical protein
MSYFFTLRKCSEIAPDDGASTCFNCIVAADHAVLPVFRSVAGCSYLLQMCVPGLPRARGVNFKIMYLKRKYQVAWKLQIVWHKALFMMVCWKSSS